MPAKLLIIGRFPGLFVRFQGPLSGPVCAFLGPFSRPFYVFLPPWPLSGPFLRLSFLYSYYLCIGIYL